MHASLPNKNFQGNYFLRVFSYLSGRLYILGGIFSLMQEILHAWRESGRNSVQAGDSLNAGELEALQKLKGKNTIFKLNLFNCNYSFMIRYWLLSCLFLPPFLFWWICPNSYKSLTIEERERETERQTDSDRWREGGRGRGRKKERERQTDRDRGREGGRGRGREREGVSEGRVPSSKLKTKIQFSNSISAIWCIFLLPTFYWKSIIHSQWNIGYYHVYSSHLFWCVCQD